MNEMVIKKAKDITPYHRNEHEPFEYYKYEVTKHDDFNQCNISIYEIPPLKSNYPYHYHTQNTEAFYIINGTGEIRTPNGNIQISAGDIIVIPPGEPGAHRITNTSEQEVLKYIDFDTTNSPDIVHYPDSKKTGILIHGKSVSYYVDETKVDYYNGE